MSSNDGATTPETRPSPSVGDPVAAVLTTPAAKRVTVATRRAALPLLRQLRPDRYTDASPYRVLSVPTESVTHMQQRWKGPIQLPWLEGAGSRHLPSLRRRWHAGIVLDGDWDQATAAFADYHLTRVLTARFGQELPWGEIPYVRKALRKVRAGEAAWGGRCRTEEDVHARCRYLDELHVRLASSGYRAELRAGEDRLAFTYFLVNIGRDGTIIRNSDGKHRIILSRILGISRVQARVLVRHRGWQRVRDAVRRGDRDVADRHRGHPDLVDVLAHRPERSTG